MDLLEVEHIDVAYGPIQALRGVSLRVGAGEMVAMLGPNGAGKTTTLRTISGLLAPRAGQISFEGKPVAGMPVHRVVEVGIAHVPEGRELFPSLSVVENLRLGHWVHRGDHADYEARLEQAMSYFPKLRQRATQAAGTLSGGEQQMLVVARGLMSSPKLLLVDELSLGLAPLVVDQLFDILGEINRGGTSILLVEQFVHLALAHTHRAYVLSKGEVQVEGLSKDLNADPALLASYLGGGEAPTKPSRRRAATPRNVAPSKAAVTSKPNPKTSAAAAKPARAAAPKGTAAAAGAVPPRPAKKTTAPRGARPARSQPRGRG